METKQGPNARFIERGFPQTTKKKCTNAEDNVFILCNNSIGFQGVALLSLLVIPCFWGCSQSFHFIWQRPCLIGWQLSSLRFPPRSQSMNLRVVKARWKAELARGVCITS